jgi:hypothetical protein
MLDKMQRIFGNDRDPIIQFQIRKMKSSLVQDIRRLAMTGTDLHEIQE